MVAQSTNIKFGFYAVMTMFTVCDWLFWRSASRRLRPLRFARLWRGLLAAYMVPMIAYLFLMAFWAYPIRRSQGPVPIVVHATVYLWHFAVLPTAMIFMFSGPIWRKVTRKMFGKGKQRLGFENTGNTNAPASRSTEGRIAPLVKPAHPSPSALSPQHSALLAPTRRQMLSAAAMAVPPLAAGATAVGAVKNLYGWRIRRFTLTIPRLPRELDGMTIAHVSDIHIGKFFDPARLPAIADDINHKLNADFIAFTGDLIDLALDDLPFGIDFLRSLKPRRGMVICEGNHDLMQNHDLFESRMQDAGLPLIVNGQSTLRYVSNTGKDYPVQFLAVPWVLHDQEMNENVHDLAPLLHDDAFPILLAHHPHSFDAAAQTNIPLVLSGHTHGGQIMLTDQIGIGSIRFRYTSGLYQKPGSTLIVNNGLGNWFPVRINAPTELVHITLRAV